jgi:hypothetical protein
MALTLPTTDLGDPVARTSKRPMRWSSPREGLDAAFAVVVAQDGAAWGGRSPRELDLVATLPLPDGASFWLTRSWNRPIPERAGWRAAAHGGGGRLVKWQIPGVSAAFVELLPAATVDRPHLEDS